MNYFYKMTNSELRKFQRGEAVPSIEELKQRDWYVEYLDVPDKINLITGAMLVLVERRING